MIKGGVKLSRVHFSAVSFEPNHLGETLTLVGGGVGVITVGVTYSRDLNVC